MALFFPYRSLENIQNEPTLVPEDVSTASTLTTYESATHPGRAQLFEQLPPQTDWTQDLEDLLLDSDSVSHSRSPTLSAPDPAPSYDQTIPAPSCDQPMAEVDEDFDLDELLLSLTGHEVPSAFPLSDSRNGLRSGLNPQLPPSIPLTMQQSPAVASDLRSIYQFPAPPLSAGLAATLAPSIVSTAFTSPVLSLSLPCIEAAPAPAQEPAHSVPSPTSLDGFAEHFFDGSEHPTLSPTVPSAPSLLGSGYATAEGSPDLGMEPYFHPGVAFHSTTSFDWTILAGVALPMHAEPSLVTDRDGEGMPDRSEGSESFEFVSPPSVSAINGDGSDHIEHIDSHDWWSGFAGLTPLISAPQPDPHCTLEFEQDQGQEQLCLVELSEATSPQVQIEPLDEQVQIDGDLVVAHAEVVDQIAEERQVQVPAQERGLPLHLVQPESMLHTDPSMNLTPVQHLDLSHPLSPPIVVEGPEPASSQPVSSTLLHCQYPAHQHATKKCPCSFRASMPTKSRQRKRKVAIDEDTVPVTDRNGNEDSGADMGGKKPMKRQKAESAKPRAKRTKELATKKNGVRVEETTEGSIEEPVRERMFVTTDETGRLKMLPVRTRVTQHDEEVGSSANSSLQLSQIQLLPLPQVDVSSSRLPQVRPIVPRRILPHPDTSHHATQPLAAHPQNTPNTLVTTIPPKSHVPALPSGPQVSLSAAQHGTQGTLLARPRAHPHIASPLPAPVPAPTPAGSIVAPLPRYAASCNHFESWNVGLMEMESESEAQILKALPPPIRRHQAQSYRLGTADTHSQIDVGQSGGTQIRYQQQVLPVYSEYSTIRDSACVPVPGQAHAQGCHQPKSAPATAPATAPAPLCLASYTHVETLQSQYYHLEAQQQIQPGVRQTLRVPQTQALQGSLMHAVPPVEVAQYHQYQHERRHQPSFQLPYTYDPYQCHHYPPLYSHQHPDASIYAQIPIEQQYPPQYGQESYISAHHLPYV